MSNRVQFDVADPEPLPNPGGEAGSCGSRTCGPRTPAPRKLWRWSIRAILVTTVVSGWILAQFGAGYREAKLAYAYERHTYGFSIVFGSDGLGWDVIFSLTRLATQVDCFRPTHVEIVATSPTADPVDLGKLSDFGRLAVVQYFGPPSKLVIPPHLALRELLVCPADDVMLDRLENLGGLRRLILNGGRVQTPSGLRTLARLESLDTLIVFRDEFSAEHVAALQSLPRLEKLVLMCRNVDDDFIDALLALPHLTYLDIHNTPISPAGQQRLESRMGLRVQYDNDPFQAWGDWRSPPPADTPYPPRLRRFLRPPCRHLTLNITWHYDGSFWDEAPL